MGKIFEKALEKVKYFYIEQLIETGKYKMKELITMTISELKYIYMQEKQAQVKRS